MSGKGRRGRRGRGSGTPFDPATVPLGVPVDRAEESAEEVDAEQDGSGADAATPTQPASPATPAQRPQVEPPIDPSARRWLIHELECVCTDTARRMLAHGDPYHVFEVFQSLDARGRPEAVVVPCPNCDRRWMVADFGKAELALPSEPLTHGRQWVTRVLPPSVVQMMDQAKMSPARQSAVAWAASTGTDIQVPVTIRETSRDRVVRVLRVRHQDGAPSFQITEIAFDDTVRRQE